MSKEIALEIKVKSDTVEQANKRMGTAQQELRRIKNELASGELKGEAFEQAAQRAAKLQDSIGDVNRRVRALASDTKKLDAFIGVAQGIAGGFAAAQGAAALFGSQNEDLNRTLVKLQGAMSLLNGVQAVANTLNKDSAASTILFSKAKRTLALVTGQATGAIKVFRLALAATGVGALVVGLGLLIAKFDKVKKAVLDFIPGLAKVGEWFTKIKNAVTDYIGISSDTTRAIEAQEAAFRSKQNTMEYEIRLMEAMGKSEEDIFYAKFNLIKDELDLLKAKQKQQGELEGKELERFQELTIQLAALQKQRGDKIAEGFKKQADDRQKASEVDLERRLMLIQDEEKRERALLLNKQKKEMQLAKVNGENLTTLRQLQEQERQELFDKFRQKEIQAEEEQNKAIEAERKRRNKELEDQEARTQANIIAKNREAEKERLDNARQSDALLLESKRQGQAAIFSLLQSIEKGTEQEQKKAFNRNKALAIAETTINTYDAAQRAYKSQLALSTPDAPIRATIAAAAAIASGLARVKQISSQNFKGSGGGGATSTGGGAGAAAFQRTPIAPQVRGVEIEDRRVYVLEGDISRTQRRVRTLEQQSIID
jgi:hypothetical protein